MSVYRMTRRRSILKRASSWNRSQSVKSSGPRPASPTAPAWSAIRRTALTRAHTSANVHAHRRDTPNRHRSTAGRNPRRHAVSLRPRSITALAITSHLRVHPGDGKFRALDHRLRVRMLTGWAHKSTPDLGKIRNFGPAMPARRYAGPGPRRGPPTAATHRRPTGLLAFSLLCVTTMKPTINA